MATPIPCEALATKAELQELETEIQTLRNQINQLLGQPEEEGGQQIDVLGLGSLAGTILAGTIFKAGEAITDIQLSGSFGSNIGNALLKGEAQFVKVSGRGVTSFQVYVFKVYPGAGEKSGIKLPVGKGICLITDAKMTKKPRRKQLNNLIGGLLRREDTEG